MSKVIIIILAISLAAIVYGYLHDSNVLVEKVRILKEKNHQLDIQNSGLRLDTLLNGKRHRLEENLRSISDSMIHERFKVK